MPIKVLCIELTQSKIFICECNLNNEHLNKENKLMYLKLYFYCIVMIQRFVIFTERGMWKSQSSHVIWVFFPPVSRKSKMAGSHDLFLHVVRQKI